MTSNLLVTPMETSETEAIVQVARDMYNNDIGDEIDDLKLQINEEAFQYVIREVSKMFSNISRRDKREFRISTDDYKNNNRDMFNLRQDKLFLKISILNSLIGTF